MYYIHSVYGLSGAGELQPPFSNAPVFDSRLPVTPSLKDLMENPPSRYGRFDGYTRQAFYCGAKALLAAGIKPSGELRNIGICLTTDHECLQTDYKYYATTEEQDGAFTSPNLFSYTLPGIAGGELAISFGLTGPLLISGDDRGPDGPLALETGLLMIESGQAEAMLCGWNEYTDGIDSARNGAVFAVLSSGQKSGSLNRPCDPASPPALLSLLEDFTG